MALGLYPIHGKRRNEAARKAGVATYSADVPLANA